MAGRIVVGVDGSEVAGHALLWACAEAGRRRAQLVIAHAGDIVRDGDRGSPDGLDYSRIVLREAMATAMDDGAACEVSTVLREQSPATLLIDLSADADLVVVGTHGAGRVVGTLLGSVAYRVSAHAHCPVVVVNQVSADRPGGATAVAVGVSDSASGRKALQVAFAEADMRRAPLLAVRSWEDEADVVDGGQRGFQHNEAIRQGEQQLLTRLVEAAWQDHPSVHAVTELSSEPVHDALLAGAGQADLLVVGCRRDEDPLGSRLGPITSRLLHSAPCPVLVVGSADDPEIPGLDPTAQAIRAGRLAEAEQV